MRLLAGASGFAGATGQTGVTGGSPPLPPYQASCQLLFEDVQAVQAMGSKSSTRHRLQALAAPPAGREPPVRRVSQVGRLSCHLSQ